MSVVNRKIILFVCTGNSCRSVMAQGLMQKKMRDLGRTDIEVFSAGVMMLDGIGASQETQELLRREGVDVSAHRSHRITQEMALKADLILVMETIHEQKVLQMFPQVKNRLFLLKEFAKTDGSDLNIADPVGRTEEFYEQTFNIIKEAIDKISRIV